MKLEILACHESRIVWLNDRDDKDVLAAPRIFARVRSIQCGATYAEVFRLYRTSL